MSRLLALILLAVPAWGSPETRREDVERAVSAYAPLFRERGLTLAVVWDDAGLPFARADRLGALLMLGVDKSLLSDPKLSDEGFRFTLCHELSHLMATEPLRPAPPEYEGATDGRGNMLMSAEGEADYQAARECFGRVPWGPGPERPAPQAVELRCASRADSALCRRAALAGLDFLLGQSLQVPIAFGTPDPEIVERTYAGGYPSRQCRLDTILAGATGAPRPACWFKD